MASIDRKKIRQQRELIKELSKKQWWVYHMRAHYADYVRRQELSEQERQAEDKKIRDYARNYIHEIRQKQ